MSFPAKFSGSKSRKLAEVARMFETFFVIGRALPLGCLSCHTSLVFLGISGLSFGLWTRRKSHNNMAVSGGRYSGNKGLPGPFLLAAGL